MTKQTIRFLSKEDKDFIDNLEPRPGEPVHSDLWSQIYDYLNNNHQELTRPQRSEYLKQLLTYKESIL